MNMGYIIAFAAGTIFGISWGAICRELEKTREEKINDDIRRRLPTIKVRNPCHRYTDPTP